MDDPNHPETLRTIYVVDDDPITLRLEDKMLRDWAYRTKPILSGRVALEAIRAVPPDLVILDINMPEMDGYAVCEALKSDPKTAGIPVVFITAYNETAEKVRAFKAGGVDYITKPFQPDEVGARLATHLALVEKARALKDSYEKLRQAESMRDAMISMVIHDLRSPLAATGLSLEYLFHEDRETLSDDSINMVGDAIKSVKWMSLMISALLDLNKLESGQMPLSFSEWDLSAILREAVTFIRAIAGGCALVHEPFSGKAPVRADRDLIFRVFQALLGNSVKMAKDGGTVRVGLRRDGEFFRIRVRDDAALIPKEYHEILFDKFKSAKSRAQKRAFSTGLALPFCKAAVEVLGGRIGLESDQENGNTFWILLPASPSQAV